MVGPVPSMSTRKFGPHPVRAQHRLKQLYAIRCDEVHEQCDAGAAGARLRRPAGAGAARGLPERIRRMAATAAKGPLQFSLNRATEPVLLTRPVPCNLPHRSVIARGFDTVIVRDAGAS